jgi:hypothetical protein
MSVYKAINAVQADIARIGISKSQENKFDNYKFRGIDDIYNALAPLVAKHGLVILPEVVNHQIEERKSQKDTALFYVRIHVRYHMTAVSDPDKSVTVTMMGEAMDRGDKAINKAMSSAYKNFAFQTFVIPTEGDNDTENQTHEVKAMPDRTKVMKVAAAINDKFANDNEMGALNEWEEVRDDHDFAGMVWSQLPTPNRAKLRDLATASAKGTV